MTKRVARNLTLLIVLVALFAMAGCSCKEYEEQIKDIQADKEEVIEEVNERWEEIASQVSEIQVTPYKKNILVELFGVAWFPHYVVKTGGRILELEGYSG